MSAPEVVDDGALYKFTLYFTFTYIRQYTKPKLTSTLWPGLCRDLLTVKRCTQRLSSQSLGQYTTKRQNTYKRKLMEH